MTTKNAETTQTEPLPECVVQPESVAVEGTFASPEEAEEDKREAEDERLEDFADDGFEATLTLTKGSNSVTGKVDVKSGDGVRELMLQLADQIGAGHDIDLGHPSNSCSKCGARAWQVQDGQPCTPKAV